MRHILRGYTMYARGIDLGYEVEELSCPLPNEVYDEHHYGGTVMTAQVSKGKIELLEPTFKLQSHNPRIVELLLPRLGSTETFTFRAALVDETDGATRANLIIYEGRLATPETDPWSREDKSGIEFTIKGVRYFRYEIGNDPIHEIGLYPARMRVNRVNRLAAINDALGR